MSEAEEHLHFFFQSLSNKCWSASRKWVPWIDKRKITYKERQKKKKHIYIFLNIILVTRIQVLLNQLGFQ